MKKLVTLAAAGLMVAGGALVSAPAASAYPAGSAPAASIVGSNRLAPNQVSAARAFNFKPRCTVKFTFTRVGSDRVLLSRKRIVSANRSVTLAFRAPNQAGRYSVAMKQVKRGGCAGLSSAARFRVVAAR